MTNDFTELINSPVPVLIDFTAVWCEPCKKQAAELKKLVENFEDDELIIMQIDIDKNKKLSNSLKVDKVPTLVLYQNGKMLWRKTGGEWADILERVIKEKAVY